MKNSFSWMATGFIFAIILALSLRTDSLAASQSEPAQPASSTAEIAALSACENLDVVFIVDQSKSMGDPTSGLMSDPLQGRKFAVAAMIELLADLAVDQCAESNYRVAVVSFGSQKSARIDLPLSNISPDTIEEAQSLRNKLIDELEAADLGQTYPLEGFALADQIFREAGTMGDTPRKKVIIFVTDGIPCTDTNLACMGGGDPGAAAREVVVYIESKFPFNATLLEAEQCLSALRMKADQGGLPPSKDEVNACVQLVPDNKKKLYYGESTYVYTVLLKSPQDYGRDVLSQFEQMSIAHGGRMVELKRNLSEFPTTMRQIVSELAGIKPNLLTCGSPFAVNPYLKRLRVNVYNISKDNAITLSYVDAKGERHQIKAGDFDGGFTMAEPYYTYGVNERYVFAYPYPGLWQVTADNCNGVDIYVEAIDFLKDVEYYQPNLPQAIPQYDIAPFYSQDEKFILEYQMVAGGNIVEQAEPTLFAIDVKAQVTRPDGTSYTISMPYNAAGKKFIASSPIQVPQPGEYQLVLTGSTLIHEGDIVVNSGLGEEQVFNTPHELFRFESKYTVFEVTPFVLQEVSPQNGETVYHVHQTLWEGGWPLANASLPVRVRMADRQGQPIANWDAVFANDNQAVTARLVSADGTESEALTLQPDPDNPGEYAGEFVNWGFSGPQTIEYRININSVTTTYRPDRHTFEVPFSRADGLWQRSVTYIVIFWAIVAMIVAIIIYNILIRTNKITGSLVFVDGSDTLAEFGLYSGTNFRIIKGKELSLYPQFNLKRIKAYNIGKKRRGGGEQESVDVGELSGVRVECVSLDGNRFSIDLYPKTPTVYSDSGVGMMIYEPIEQE